MTTRKLYYENSYLKQFNASIISVNDDDMIILDQTAFYPGGGGQPPDNGMILIKGIKIPVIKATYQDKDTIAHQLDLKELEVHVKELLQPGTTITGIINWDRRLAFMRYHTALHILSAVMNDHFNAPATGGQLYENKARMDFEIDKIDIETARQIEELVNEEIKKEAPVKTYFITKEELNQHPELIRTKNNLIPPHVKKIRIVEIQGIDVQADGGLHVNNTKELEEIRIVKRENRGKGHKRIYIQFISDK